MCGHFGLEYGKDFYPRFLLKNQLPGLVSNLNISPGQQVPIIINQNCENILQSMKWGLIPFWSKDQKIGSKLFNARLETIQEKPSFKNAFKNRRCLIPASIFYEWRDEGEKKIPYGFKPENEKYFAMAGIYEIWTDPSGIKIPTFTILTTTPSSVIRPFHDRMPVVLDRDEELDWLLETAEPENLLKHALSEPKYKMSINIVKEFL